MRLRALATPGITGFLLLSLEWSLQLDELGVELVEPVGSSATACSKRATLAQVLEPCMPKCWRRWTLSKCQFVTVFVFSGWLHSNISPRATRYTHA